MVSHEYFAFTIGVQHLLGLVTGLILAATAHRAGVRSPWHLVAGAAVFFGGDFLYLEHLVMTESIMLFLIAGGVYATVEAFGEAHPSAWLAVASGLLAAAALVRWNASALILGPLAVGVLRAAPASRRVTHLLAATAPFVVAVVVYGLASTAAGTYSGIDDMRGWHLYGRVAPFLDCQQTTADDRLPGLCEGTPPGARPGPFFYTWDPTSPARSLWGLDPARSDDLFAPGVDTVLHEPVAYARAVGRDLVRLVDPSLPMPGYSGQPPSIHDFRYRDEAVEATVEHWLDQRYEGTRVVIRPGIEVLYLYQQVTRIPGGFVLAGLVVSIAGLVVAPGRRRAALGILLYSALALYVLPIMTVSWDYRYGLPGTAILWCAATVAVAGIAERWRASPSRTVVPNGAPASAADADVIEAVP